jgi:uncharacterized membrane protein
MLAKISLILAGITSAIMAGLFFAWSFSVMLGLAKISDRDFIAAMQSMNREIQNFIFLAFFLGTPIFLILATVTHYQTDSFWLLLIATIVYLIGVFGVTFLGNIPLNNALGAFQLDKSSAEQMSEIRTRFENSWVRLNFIRTICSFISIVLVMIAAVYLSEN